MSDAKGKWTIRYSGFDGEWRTLQESDVFPAGGRPVPFVYSDFDAALLMADQWRLEHADKVDKVLVEPLKA